MIYLTDSWIFLSSNAGMFSRFSLVNTLQKTLFTVVALPSFDLANLLSSSRSAISLLVFNLLLAYAWKALGLLFASLAITDFSNSRTAFLQHDLA